MCSLPSFKYYDEKHESIPYCLRNISGRIIIRVCFVEIIKLLTRKKKIQQYICHFIQVNSAKTLNF